MDTNKIIDLNKYKQKKRNQRLKEQETINKTEEDRQVTLNLFMRVLETMRKESY